MSAKACYRSLCAAGERLDPILKPLGYVFQPDEMIPGLPFVSAVFIQGELVINIYYKRGPTFGPVMYVNARGGMNHGELMRTLGFADRQLLVCEEATLRVHLARRRRSDRRFDRRSDSGRPGLAGSSQNG